MLLSLLVFLPLVLALGVAIWPDKNTARQLAFIGAVLEFVVSLAVFFQFDPTQPTLQLVERHMWVSRFGISYFLGVDGISIMLVMLTTFLTPIIILASWRSIDEKVRGFHSALFILQTAMLGSFLSMDAILFYVFWELSLVPMYFIVGIWGGARRIYATIKFFIYTMAGSVLMLLAIIFLMRLTPEVTGGAMSASLLDFYKLEIPFIAGEFFTPP
jgi:NADH-quinone oxidoreductase subunit M